MVLIFIVFLQFIGVVAATCIPIPQIMKTLHKKTLSGVSFLAFKFYWLGKILAIFAGLFGDKWASIDGLILNFAIAVLTLTLCVLYKYSYLEKQQKRENGEEVLMFFPQFKPWIYSSLMGVIFLVVMSFSIYTNVWDFHFKSEIGAYFFIGLVTICHLLLGLQIYKTVKTKNTEGLSFGFVVFGLAAKATVLLFIAFFFALREYILSRPDASEYSQISEISAETFWVGLFFWGLETALFAILTTLYIKYSKWDKKPLKDSVKSLTNSKALNSQLQN